jgi:YHS domain-containing protein
MNKYIFIGIIVPAFAACRTPSGKDSPAPAATGAQAMDSVKTYDAAILDNKKDPVCGMPSGAGMEDTLHINGKVIGFCSKECKAAFLKAPKSYPVVYK